MEINQHIFLVGFMGCGKTTLSKILAETNKMPLIDTDHYIEKKLSNTIPNIFTEKGEKAFREIETKVLEEIIKQPPSIISTGGGMPCFAENMDIMLQSGITVYLKATPETLANILQYDINRPLVKGKTKDELLQFITNTLAHREQYYNKAKLVIEALIRTPEEMAKNLNVDLRDLCQAGR